MKCLARITSLQFFFLTINISFGSSMLTLPRKVAEIAKGDMWLSVLLGSCLIFFSFRVAVRLAEYFPDKTILDYHQILLGRWLGLLLNIYIIVLMVMITAVLMRTYTTSVKIYLLDLTPPNVISALILVPAIYGIQYGLGPVLRYIQFVFLPSYGLFLLTIVLGILSIDSKEYLPLMEEGIEATVKAIVPTWIIYTGPEFLILFLYPYITKPASIRRFGNAAIAILAGMYLLITLITEGILGAEKTADFIVPTVMAYRAVEIPDTFIERLDGYLMTFWILVCYSSELCWIYLIAFAIEKMVKLEYSRCIVPFLILILLYLILLTPDTPTAEQLGSIVNMAGMTYGLGVLPLLLLLAWHREKREKPC